MIRFVATVEQAIGKLWRIMLDSFSVVTWGGWRFMEVHTARKSAEHYAGVATFAGCIDSLEAGAHMLWWISSKSLSVTSMD